MNLVKPNLGFIALLVSVLLVSEAKPRGAARAQTPDQNSAVEAGETAHAKIALSLIHI